MSGQSGIVFAAALALLVVLADCRPPVREQPKTPEVTNHNASSGDWDLGVSYNRYLKEVVQVLESDHDFRKKLESSDVEKIRDGSIADSLNFVKRNLRDKLDDIKMQEVSRLRMLAVKKARLEGRGAASLDDHGHVDTKSIKFEVEDLRRLIKATTDDLEEADKQRREDFKKYEMEKHFREQERLKTIKDEEERKKEEERLRTLKDKHKDHPKLHHPITKDQLEEVWEESDHMQPEDFDPKTFFAMHDLNGDGFWEEDEIKALFEREMEKVYDPEMPEDDMREKFEEIERMREHAMREMDKDKDRLVSLQEFLDKTKEQDFDNDEGWDPIGESDKEYSDDDFHEFETHRQREAEEMMARGVMPPYYQNLPHGGIPPPFPHPGQGVPGSIPGQPAYIPPSQAGQQFNPGQQQPRGPGQPAAMPHQQQPPVGGGFQQQQPPVGGGFQQPGQPAAAPQVPVNTGSIPGQPAYRAAGQDAQQQQFQQAQKHIQQQPNVQQQQFQQQQQQPNVQQGLNRQQQLPNQQQFQQRNQV